MVGSAAVARGSLPVALAGVPSGAPAEVRTLPAVSGGLAQVFGGKRRGLSAKAAWAAGSGASSSTCVGPRGDKADAAAMAARASSPGAAGGGGGRGGLRGILRRESRAPPPPWQEEPSPLCVRFRGTGSLASFHIIDQEEPPLARLSKRLGGSTLGQTTLGSTTGTLAEVTMHPGMFSKLPPVDRRARAMTDTAGTTWRSQGSRDGGLARTASAAMAWGESEPVPAPGGSSGSSSSGAGGGGPATAARRTSLTRGIVVSTAGGLPLTTLQAPPPLTNPSASSPTAGDGGMQLGGRRSSGSLLPPPPPPRREDAELLGSSSQPLNSGGRVNSLGRSQTLATLSAPHTQLTSSSVACTGGVPRQALPPVPPPRREVVRTSGRTAAGAGMTNRFRVAAA